MRKAILLLIFSSLLFVGNTEAQNKKSKKTISKSAKLKKSKKFSRTISMGVINGRAIDLVKPEYPKSARHLNVYGQVSVQILIDEYGAVISAKGISGHPLLKFVSVNAALNSKFEPVTLSGEPVRIKGVIIYKFKPDQWNWLEIGFALNNHWSSYYLLKDLSETLPVGFEEEKQLLQQLFQNSENDGEIKIAIVASITGKLIENQKADWLFLVGSTLGQISHNNCRINEENQRLFEKLKILLQSKPENVSTALISNLENLTSLTENPDLNTYSSAKDDRICETLKNLESNFPFYK